MYEFLKQFYAVWKATSNPDDYRVLELKPKLKHYYQKITKKKYTEGCKSCTFDNFVNICSSLGITLTNLKTITEKEINDIMEKFEKSIKIKAGNLLELDGRFYTSETPMIEDEIGEKLTLKYGEDNFETLPDFSEQKIDYEEPTLKVESLKKDFTKLTIKELKEIAEVRGIDFKSNIKKSELLKLIDNE